MNVRTLFQELLFVTVRLECQRLSDCSVGTAFLVTHPNTAGDDTLWMVTNKHVVEGASAVRFFFLRGESGSPKLGERASCEMPVRKLLWHPHPDPNVDVIVCPLGPIMQLLQDRGVEVFIRTVGWDTFLSDEHLQVVDAVQEVFFVGYPVGLYDSVNLLPIVRRGITATPLEIDYEGRREFLLDAAVFPGSSGSPVFISIGEHFSQGLVFLAGLIAKRMLMRETGEIEFVDVPTAVKPVAHVMQGVHLGVAVKARAIHEAIEDWFTRRGTIKSPDGS